MNAKELRTAAEILLEDCDTIGVTPLQQLRRLAEHILSTVKEDDDEPITEEWTKKQYPKTIPTKFTDIEIRVDKDGDIILRDNGAYDQTVVFCWGKEPTRGQLRRLLENLEVNP